MTDLQRIKQKIESKLAYYQKIIPQDAFDFGVLYACEVFLSEIKQISDLTNQETVVDSEA